MTSERTPYFLQDLFPHARPELLRLLDSAADNALLLRSDFFTIRDWLELAEYSKVESLHVLLLIMLLALEEGSLCVEVSADALTRRLTDLVDDAEGRRWAERILADLAGTGFPRLIGSAVTDHRPVIRHESGGRIALYFQKYLKAELEFVERFDLRLQSHAGVKAIEHLPAVLKEVLADKPLLQSDGKPLCLDREQRLAVGVALTRDFAVISGGPGTGKTSIVLTLLRCLVRAGFTPERIALAAPTGRAAQRLSDALRLGLAKLPSAADEDSPDRKLLGLSATTLHQLLGYRPSRNLFSRHAENPIPADVVIVDEVSMVGLVLMAQLLQALGPATKLVWLGDKDQLPSIEAGAILATLVPEGSMPAFGPSLHPKLAALFPDIEIARADTDDALRDSVVALQTNHRSQPEIRAVAEAINRQDTGITERIPLLTLPVDAAVASCWRALEAEGGCRLLEPVHGSAGELHGMLIQWAEHVYFGSRLGAHTLGDLVQATVLDEAMEEEPTSQQTLKRLFDLLDRFRLLTLLREGSWGVVSINRFIDQVLRPRLDPEANSTLFAGAPVLVTRNDASRQLNNGDVGLALRYRQGLRVVFPRQGSFVSFPAESLPAHELGFALTVHKSQGSEYANVMVILPPEGGRRLLTKELVYTAVTRAKSLAILCGSKEVLKLAIRRRVMREAGLLGREA